MKVRTCDIFHKTKLMQIVHIEKGPIFHMKTIVRERKTRIFFQGWIHNAWKVMVGNLICEVCRL
jgi:hypothetical protein